MTVMAAMLAVPALAQYQKAQGFCDNGASTVAIPGTQGSTTTFQKLTASCVVTIYDTGTVNLSTIYSDSGGTAKANPFTAASTGLWFFYADPAKHYDVVTSGGVTFSDVAVNTLAGGMPGSLGTANQLLEMNSGANAAVWDNTLRGTYTFSGFDTFTGAGSTTLNYGARTDHSGVVVNRTVTTSLGSDFDSGALIHRTLQTGGSWASQTPYPGLTVDQVMQTQGQNAGIFAYLRSTGEGNTMGFNPVLECYPGPLTGANIQCSGLGEIDVGIGGIAHHNNIFSATLVSPTALATTFTYTGDTNAQLLGEGALLMNLTTGVVTGDGATCKITGVSTTTLANDTFAFSGCTAWTAAAIGGYIKLGSTTEDYVSPCSGDDVIPPFDTKCIGHWWRVIAVPDGTHLQIQVGYDTAHLTSATNASFMFAQALPIVSFDTTDKTITVGANSYSWANSDSVIVAPQQFVGLHGIYVNVTPVFKSSGTAYGALGIQVGNQSASVPLLYGVNVECSAGGCESAYSVSNPHTYGLNLSKTTATGADIIGTTAMKFQWGVGGMALTGIGGPALQLTGGTFDVGNALNLSDQSTYAYVQGLSGKALAFGANATVYQQIDSTGKFQLGNITDALNAGTLFAVSGHDGFGGISNRPNGVSKATCNSAIRGTWWNVFSAAGTIDQNDFCYKDAADTYHWGAALSQLQVGGGAAITKHLSATASLDFAAWAGGDCQDLTVTVTGAADGNTVTLGVPNALASTAGVQFSGFVSASNTVTVRGCKITTGASADPAAATVRADVWQH